MIADLSRTVGFSRASADHRDSIFQHSVPLSRPSMALILTLERMVKNTLATPFNADNKILSALCH